MLDEDYNESVEEQERLIADANRTIAAAVICTAALVAACLVLSYILITWKG